MAKVLIIDDDKLIRWSLEKNLLAAGYAVETAESGEEGMSKMESFSPDAIILDNRLPGMNGLEVLEGIRQRDPDVVVLFMTAYGTVETAVEAMKKGAYDYINKPFVFEEVAQLLEKGLEKQRLSTEVGRLRRMEQRHYDLSNVIVRSPVMLEVMNLVDKIAHSEAHTVLLTGESGVGKDLIARIIHQKSSRRNRPFVTISCSSVPETLLESELFGYEKGAFTDAKSSKKGQFEMASGGVVYLDEIGEIPLGLQVKLLQVIENRVFRKVGGVRDIHIDVLLIAATNIDLSSAVEAGLFRRDLYYRLNLIPIHIPPLRERREEIIPLAEYFLRRFSEEFRKKFQSIDETVQKVLYSYNWPGNVRELRNIIERIVILENDTSIRWEHLPSELRSLGEDKWLSPPSVQPADDDNRFPFRLPEQGIALEEVERMLVIQSLERTNFNQSRAARLLHISRDALRYKMKKFGLL
ncbi:MAG: sigma-54-dependent transcriptional regulator [bacterium]